MDKISFRNPLHVSFAVIFLVWMQDIARQFIFPSFVTDLYQSIPRFLLTAFLFGIIYILVVVLLLRYSKETFPDIGFSRINIDKQIRNGVLIGLGIFIFITFLVSPVVDALLPKTAAEGIDKSALFSSALMVPLLILLTAFKGGLSEELWRIFYLTRFQKAWGKTGLILSIIIGSVMFGLGHIYQGTGAVISTAIIGVLYAVVYLRKRLAWEVIIAHATYDCIAIVLGFIIYGNG